MNFSSISLIVLYFLFIVCFFWARRNDIVFVRGFVAFDWASMWHEYGILGLVARAISTNGPKTLILKNLISDLFSAMNFSDRAIGLGRLFRSISIPWFSGVLSVLLIQRIKC